MAKRSVAVTRGSLSHWIVPQSKTWVSTLAGFMNRRPASLDMLAPFAVAWVEIQILETSYLLGNGSLSRQTLDARGAKEPADALCPAEDVLDIVGLGDRATMTEDQDLRLDGDCRFLDGLNAGNRLIESDGRFGADCPFRSQSHVCNQEICAGSCHGLRFVFIEDIGAGEQIQIMRLRNHLDFLRVTHAGLLQILAEEAIDQPHRGEVLHP